MGRAITVEKYARYYGACVLISRYDFPIREAAKTCGVNYNGVRNFIFNILDLEFTPSIIELHDKTIDTINRHKKLPRRKGKESCPIKIDQSIIDKVKAYDFSSLESYVSDFKYFSDYPNEYDKWRYK